MFSVSATLYAALIKKKKFTVRPQLYETYNNYILHDSS